jgi:hypothetical protein
MNKKGGKSILETEEDTQLELISLSLAEANQDSCFSGHRLIGCG